MSTKPPRVTVQQRTLVAAFNAIAGGNRNPLTLADLEQLFLFIDLVVGTGGLLYDGTVPMRDRERMHNISADLISKLNHNCSIYSGFSIRPINVDDLKARRAACARAATRSAALIADIAKTKAFFSCDHPLPDDECDEVFLGMERGLTLVTHDQRMDYALRIAHGEIDFRGAKCLAGILTADVAESQLLNPVSESFLKSEKAARSRLVGALINRFRLNYLPIIADGESCVHIPDPSLLQVRKHEIGLITQHVARDVAQHSAPGSKLNIDAKLMQTVSLFPTTYLALMRSNTKNIYELISEVDAVVKEIEPIITHVNEELTKATAGGCADRPATSPSVKTILDKLVIRAAQRPSKLYSATVTTIPIAGGTIAQLVTNALLAMKLETAPCAQTTSGIVRALVSEALKKALPATRDADVRKAQECWFRMSDIFRQAFERGEEEAFRLRVCQTFGRELETTRQW